jgi:hypothetical protein
MLLHLIPLITFCEQYRAIQIMQLLITQLCLVLSSGLQFITFTKTAEFQKTTCLISGFCCDVYEICALLGCYAVCSGNSLLTFQDNIPVPSSGVNKPKNKAIFLGFFTLEDGTDRLSWNVGKELALQAVSQLRRAQITKKKSISSLTILNILSM